MTSRESVLLAVQNYRLNLEAGTDLIKNNSEGWWRTCYFLADLICRDKIMRMLTDPNQMCTFCFKILKKKEIFLSLDFGL